MPTFGFAPCATTGCSGSYRIVSRTNWQNFQRGAPLIGSGFCRTCRFAKQALRLEETRKHEMQEVARRARDRERDAEYYREIGGDQ